MLSRPVVLVNKIIAEPSVYLQQGHHTTSTAHHKCSSNACNKNNRPSVQKKGHPPWHFSSTTPEFLKKAINNHKPLGESSQGRQAANATVQNYPAGLTVPQDNSLPD
jgi:hypothetical protein